MIKKFFILCSGADSDILNKCIKATQIKYVGIGATIFLIAKLRSIIFGVIKIYNRSKK